MGGTGEPTSGEGLGIHLYVANTSMSDAAFTNAGTCSFNHFVFCFLFFVFVSTFILSILHSLCFMNTCSSSILLFFLNFF